MLGSPSAAFLTHVDSDDSAAPQLEDEEEELLAEQQLLQSQIAAAVQRLSGLKAKPLQRSAFVPLASIFPLRRDAFSHGKSAGQQLRIYHKEHKKVLKRFQRTSDTNYSYSLEHSLLHKSVQIHQLEQLNVTLHTSNKALERDLLRVKSETAANEEAAAMTDLVAHVVLLKDQITALEFAAETREALAQTAKEALSRTESRYRKIKEVAESLGLSLKTEVPNSLKAEHEALQKRLLVLEKTACSKEQTRIRALNQEKRRLEETEEQLRTLFQDQSTSLEQARLQLSQIRSTQSRPLRLSMSTSHLPGETRRLPDTETLPQ